MPDLLAQIPEHVQHGLDHALAPGRLLVGQEKEQIDVRPRRQRAAAIAADRRHAEPLRRRGILRRIDEGHDIMMDRPEKFVFEMGETGRAGETAVVRLECGLHPFPALGERRREKLGRRLAKGDRIAGMSSRQRRNGAVELDPLDERMAGRFGPRRCGGLLGRGGGGGQSHRRLVNMGTPGRP